MYTQHVSCLQLMLASDESLLWAYCLALSGGLKCLAGFKCVEKSKYRVSKMRKDAQLLLGTLNKHVLI